MLHQYYGPKNAQISLVHEENAIPIIQSILKELAVDMIVEFGTSWGGFTLVMNDALPDCQIHTFDHTDKRVPHFGWFFKNTDNITFYQDVDILSAEDGVIISLLEQPEKKLLYCDNGNKPLEFKIYSKYLNSGDYIAVHDFDIEYKKEEITNLSIMSSFTPYKHEIFEKNGWGTRFWLKE